MSRVESAGKGATVRRNPLPASPAVPLQKGDIFFFCTCRIDKCKGNRKCKCPPLGGGQARAQRAQGVAFALCVWLVVSATGAFAMQSPSPARQLVDKYCLSCHSQRLKTGGLALEGLDVDHPARAGQTWEKVIVKLRSRAMPPANAPRPDNTAYEAAAGWLESEIDKDAAAHVNPGRSPRLHRLNRSEYSNAIRDLLGV